LKLELDASNSARQIQDLKNQIDVQDMKISDWQKTYANLLTTMRGGEVNALNIIEVAAIPSSPFSPNTQMNVMLAAVVGLVLSVGGIFLIEYFDDTVKGSADVLKATGLPVVGKIGPIGGKSYPEKLVALTKPESPQVEAFRTAAINLQPILRNGEPKCILIASASPREGKSVVTANLAVILAQAGIRVIAVDADLRKPKLHVLFGLPNEFGLRNALHQADQGVQKYLQPTKVENLRVLTSGASTNHTAALLDSSNLKLIIDELKSLADVILFDSPPSLVVADAGILASLVESVIVVADTGRTRLNDVQRAVEDFQQVTQNTKGVILNRLKESGRNYHYYHYYSDKKPGENSKVSGNHHGKKEPHINSAKVRS
jgi:capsular exopolysaccharide synthesis family protein